MMPESGRRYDQGPPQERAYIEDFSQAYIDGDPQQVKAQLEGVSETYQTADISIVTICYSFEDRVRSYELVAEACGLKQQGINAR